MKRSILYLLVVLCCGNSLFLTSCKPHDEIPALLERPKNMGPDDEKATITETYTKAKAALAKNPDDMQQYVNLASAYIAEGRVTGNNSYYSNAAVKMLDKVTSSNTGNKDILFQALSLKSAVLLNMHQFKDALAAAQQGVSMNTFNSGIYGALVDANVEMGNYDEAVKDCDKMISIRPDLRSYSRASYLRQIYGQNAGAIEAMNMAVQAGVPGMESTEWARTNLGDLYLNMGNADSASIIYRSSLVYRPDYPFAIIGMARVAKARKDYKGAIEYAKKAIQLRSEVAFVSLLADLYELNGDAAKAKDTRNDVVNLLEQGQKDEPKDALVKHNVSRELGTAYMYAGQMDKALQYANTDLAMRPDNIDANELAAWIYYLKGDYANAKVHADKMLATKTQNGNYLYIAGLIYANSGDTAKGNDLMRQGITVNPFVDQLIINQSKSKTPVALAK